jgi:hypothetical protein
LIATNDVADADNHRNQIHCGQQTQLATSIFGSELDLSMDFASRNIIHPSNAAGREDSSNDAEKHPQIVPAQPAQQFVGRENLLLPWFSF